MWASRSWACGKPLVPFLEAPTLADILVHDTIARWGVFNGAGEVQFFDF